MAEHKDPRTLENKMESPLLIKSAAFADRILDMSDYLLGEIENPRNPETKKTLSDSKILGFSGSTHRRRHVPYSLKVCVEQITRSGTSIGANVAEGSEAQSGADRASKNGIALKEARETIYWLGRLLQRNFISQEEHDSMVNDLTEIIKMLKSSINTLRKK